MRKQHKKKMTKSQAKVRIRSGKRFLVGLLVGLIMVMIGTYLLRGASRADTIPDNTIIIGNANSSNHGQYSAYKVNPQSGQVHIFIEVPQTPAGITQTHFSLFLIIHLRALNFTCASGYICDFKNGAHTGIESVYDYDTSINSSQINFCVPLKSNDANRGFVIGTLNFDPASAIHQDFGTDLRQDFYSVAAFASGPCQEPPSDKWYTDSTVENTYHTLGVKADWGERGTIGGCTGICGGDTPGDSGDRPGDGDGSGGNGNGPSGGVGGGGGSSATTQGNSSATIPFPTSQGTQEQPRVEPTPFFDGKLFVAGSSVEANRDTKAVTIGNFQLGYGWFILAGSLIAMGVGGFFGWKWWLHHKTK